MSPEELKEKRQERLARDRQRTKIQKQMRDDMYCGQQLVKEKVQIKSPGGNTKVITITENRPTGKVKHVFKNSDDNLMNLGDNIPPRLIKKLQQEKKDRMGKIEITIRPEDYKIIDPTKNDYAMKGPAQTEWYKSKK